MADNLYEQTSGSLNLKFISGDELSVSLTINKDLQGYTFEAGIKDKSAIIPIDVEELSLTEGKLNLRLTKDNSVKLGKGVYPWFFKWSNGITLRTIINGKVEVLI